MKVVTQRILAGFLARHEVLVQAQGLGAMESVSRKQKFWEDFKRAHAFKAELGPTAIPRPALSELPSSAGRYLESVESTDLFQENFGGHSFRFMQVNLEALQPLQLFINTDPKLTPPAREDGQGLLKYCLPADSEVAADILITPTGVRFTTTRYGLGPHNLQRRVVENQVRVRLEHINLLQVIRFRGTLNGQEIDRLIVANGNHRAFELMAAGHQSAPALVIEVNQPEVLQQFCPQGPGFWNLNFLLLAGTSACPVAGMPRAPLISDFLTPLAIEASVTLVPSVIDLTTGLPQIAPQQPPPFALQFRPGP